MREVGPRLVEVGDRVHLRQPAVAESGDLREDEPHPVALLAAGPQLVERLEVGVVVVLRLDEALEVVAVAEQPPRLGVLAG
jgi:hypothetical protein